MTVQRILIDGSSLLYRSWFAMPPTLTTPDGRPSGATRGFNNTLDALVTRYPEARLLVIFDARGDTFRHKQYPAYKANRESMPEQLRDQIPWIHRLVELRGLPLLIPPQTEAGAVEADDLIATLAEKFADSGEQTLIFSSDKDLAQCVRKEVELLRGIDDQPMGSAGVVDKYGVAPEQIADWLALTGDSSDNIPGVVGVGPAKGKQLLEKHGSLEGVVRAAPNLPGALGDKVRAALDDLPLYRSLVEVQTRVPIEAFELEPRAADEKGLAVLYAELGFSEARPPPAVEDHQDIQCLDSLEQCLEWLQQGFKNPPLALFFAPEKPGRAHGSAAGIGLADSAGRQAFVALVDSLFSAPSAEWMEKIVAELAAHPGQWLLPDIKESLLRAAALGMELPAGAHDPLLRSYVCNPSATRHQLEALARHHNLPLRPWEEVAGKGASAVALSQLPLDAAALLASSRAALALKLEQILAPQLEAEQRMQAIYADLELPLARVLADMESTGVLLDSQQLRVQSEQLQQQMDKVRQQAWEQAGTEFNLDSPAQVGQVLFEKMQLPMRSKTKGGQASTSESVLEELAGQGHQMPGLILEYRSLHKLLSTYTQKLPQQINPRTGRVHTSYHQMVAATGRLSSSDPNLQNIPIRTAEGRRVRHAFRAPEGCVLLAADYSQIELRVMAHLSGDPGLVAAFAAGEDIHAATARELFGEADAEGRRRAKAVNFGLIYGMSAFGLARQLKVARKEADEYIQTYFTRFPGVRTFMDGLRERAVEAGYVETLWGRRLYLPELKSSNHTRRNAAIRAAINAPMQGTAADIIKKAMLKVHGWLAEPADDSRGRLLMQVHDELVLEVPQQQADRTSQAIVGLMEQAADLKVPLVVDVGQGENWEQAKAS